MNSHIQQRYVFAKDLIKNVGEIALSFYLNRDKLNIQHKKGEAQDLVSIADQNVEKEIKTALKVHFPDDGFLGEESGADGLDKDFCWVVDPIDGTGPFLYGLHAWCISIAVLYKQEIVIGLIYDPLHKELFHATKGNGAFVNEAPLSASKATSLQEGLVGLGMSHRVPQSTFVPVIDQVLKEGGMFVRNGSGALTLAYVAAGRLIGYFEPHINAWDCLAGILLVQEAGGQTNDFLANDGLLKGNYILASSQGIFNQLEAIRSLTL
ncbi:inositol monophosphatase family protein [Avibacterium paragallinarum]|uniref:inositol monophosphatase family protein n=1 Tax=Avibacterium paragallinarum TaxID=728 RepID=UPI0039790A26